MKFSANVLSLCLLSGLLLGCDSSGNIANVDVSAPIVDPASGVPRLQSGDKIKVTVFGEDKLSGDYDVDPGGFLSLPLAGTVKVAGLTKPELEQLLAKRLRGEYLRSPKVTVEIASFRPFYVLGEVAKPGEYPYKGGMNVMSAVAVAGGQTYRASRSTVQITHAGEAQSKEYPLSPSIPIYPGDLIRVPERYF